MKQPLDRAAGMAFGRVLACFLVIAAHQDYRIYGDFASVGSAFFVAFGWVVPFFLIASGYFYGRTRSLRPVLRFAVRRLLPLYVIWVLIYLVATETFGRVLNNPADLKTWFWLLAEGGEGYHLWFLSSLGASLVAVHLVAQYVSMRTIMVLGAVCFAGGLLLGSYAPVAGLPDLRTPELSRVFPFYPVVFVAFGLWARRSGFELSWQKAAMLAMAGITLSAAELCLFRFGFGVPFTENDFAIGTVPFGIGMFFLFRRLALPRNLLSKWSRRLAPATLGIFAAHLIVLKQLESHAPAPGLLTGASILVLTFLLTTALVLGLRQVPLLKRLAG
ncbi:acyltransferase [Parvularcula lutaonensis]|uniref:Acyltransferase n=1 Tax=Parvularcula lutaonensis TaxID=491923 RepID=A0ABV7ME77_9PROT|nr:acyltransferase family protein [Parvularcula lutaonensis]GGY51155.1 fucose 4-O-acetylase [Parvularcula lutaonensis]